MCSRVLLSLQQCIHDASDNKRNSVHKNKQRYKTKLNPTDRKIKLDYGKKILVYSENGNFNLFLFCLYILSPYCFLEVTLEIGPQIQDLSHDRLSNNETFQGRFLAVYANILEITLNKAVKIESVNLCCTCTQGWPMCRKKKEASLAVLIIHRLFWEFFSIIITYCRFETFKPTLFI